MRLQRSEADESTTAGMTSATTARNSMTVAVPADVRLNFCVPCLRPPTKQDSAEHQQQVADDAAGDRRLDDRGVVGAQRRDAR